MAQPTTVPDQASDGPQASQPPGTGAGFAAPRLPIRPLPPIKPIPHPPIIRSTITIDSPAANTTFHPIEPGTPITVSGSYTRGTLAADASSLWVEIGCDGQVTTVQLGTSGPPVETRVAAPPTDGQTAALLGGGSFSGSVRCYHGGKQTITVTLKDIGGSVVDSAVRSAIDTPRKLATASRTVTVDPCEPMLIDPIGGEAPGAATGAAVGGAAGGLLGAVYGGKAGNRLAKWLLNEPHPRLPRLTTTPPPVPLAPRL